MFYIYVFCIFFKDSGTNLLCYKILKVEASPQDVTLYVTVHFVSFNKTKQYSLSGFQALHMFYLQGKRPQQPFPINDPLSSNTVG